MSDYMDRTLWFWYATWSFVLITILWWIFVYWKYSKLPFSVDNIRNRKGEILYWAAILFSNTLWTALGDFLADSSGLGFWGWALLIGSLLLIIILCKYYTKISSVVLFWIAFVLTRPFGATLWDLMTKSHEKWGLDLGTMWSSLVLLIILVICVYYSHNNYKKVE